MSHCAKHMAMALHIHSLAINWQQHSARVQCVRHLMRTIPCSRATAYRWVTAYITASNIAVARTLNYWVAGQHRTLTDIAQMCPSIPENLLRARLYAGERCLTRLRTPSRQRASANPPNQQAAA